MLLCVKSQAKLLYPATLFYVKFFGDFLKKWFLYNKNRGCELISASSVNQNLSLQQPEILLFKIIKYFLHYISLALRVPDCPETLLLLHQDIRIRKGHQVQDNFLLSIISYIDNNTGLQIAARGKTVHLWWFYTILPVWNWQWNN